MSASNLDNAISQSLEDLAEEFVDKHAGPDLLLRDGVPELRIRAVQQVGTP